MPVLVQSPLPPEFEALLERRHRLGLDRHDEIWEGVLHVVPGPHAIRADLQAQLLRRLGSPADAAGLRPLGEFNLGEPDDYRIPDGGLLGPGPHALYLPTAALVFEVLSPDDDPSDKLPFYATHRVNEVLIIDPVTHRIDWLGLDRSHPPAPATEYVPVERSRLIDLGPAELAEQIDWPPVEN